MELMLVRELLIELNCELTDVFNDLIAAVVCASVFVVPVTFNHAVLSSVIGGALPETSCTACSIGYPTADIEVEYSP